MQEHRIYCGGTFCFDTREEGYEVKAKDDYRAELLGSVKVLLKKKDVDGVRIGPNVVYIGPFFFETDDMVAEDIVMCEKQMIESCTDAIFVLDSAACPGSISEMIYANVLRKEIHVFYIQKDENTETESHLHTPCWYPILFCQMTNRHVHLYPCSDDEDAKHKVLKFVQSITH